jgi:hypothetical protein
VERSWSGSGVLAGEYVNNGERPPEVSETEPEVSRWVPGAITTWPR